MYTCFVTEGETMSRNTRKKTIFEANLSGFRVKRDKQTIFLDADVKIKINKISWIRSCMP